MATRGLLGGAILIAVTSVAVPRAALALDEEAWQVSLAGSLAFVIEKNDIGGGPGCRLDARYAVTDAASLWGALGASWHPAGEADAWRPLTTVSAGITLAWDVLRWIPFVEVGAALLDVSNGYHPERYLGAEVAGGAEYLLDRKWSLAVIGRAQYFPLQLTDWGSEHRESVFAMASLRLSLTF